MKEGMFWRYLSAITSAWTVLRASRSLSGFSALMNSRIGILSTLLACNKIFVSVIEGWIARFIDEEDVCFLSLTFHGVILAQRELCGVSVEVAHVSFNFG